MHRLLALAMALGLCTACSGDADAPDGEISSSGSGGSPGSAGMPGSGGVANVAGSTSSTGGSASGGAAAVAGSTGVAGAPNGGSSGNLAGSSNGGSAGSSTGGSAGTAGSAVVECTNAPPPAPPAEMKETIDITWTEMTGGFSGKQGARGSQRAIQKYPSWALDHVMWSKGSLNFCVRWDSEEPVTPALRDQVADHLQRGVNAWFSALSGYDCFPFASIKTNITGWATRSRATFQWSDDSLVPLYINQLSGGAPDCPDACSRNAHQSGDYQFPQCTGGFDKRFDQEVWLQEDYDAPNGWDFGQHVDRQGFTDKAVSGGLYHIWLHEFGHGIGFPDYYDWSTWAPGVTAPKCVMNAGAAVTVTDWDKWMFKRTWSELRKAGRWD